MAHQQTEPPIQVGEEVELEIINIGIKKDGSRGDGVARFNNYVIFVPDTEKGDQVKVRITKTLHRYGFAEKI